MAKYDVTHSCGHTAEHQLVGPSKDREYRISRLQGEPCRECWRSANPDKPEGYARACKGGIEIFVLKSFEVKDALKARGYRFGEYSRPGANLASALMGGSKGWGKILPGAEEAMAEIAALKDLGVGVELLNLGPVGGAIAAILEGRPDLAPSLAQDEIPDYDPKDLIV